MDPPASHQEFQSLIAGLNQCRISHALRATPMIHKNLITDFWLNALVVKQTDGVEAIESTVQGTSVVISEETIHEVLDFGDSPDFPIEYYVDRVREVLEKMGYEGVYPSTMKKLLPPY